MATIPPTVNNDVAKDGGSVISFTWAITTADTDGAPADISNYPDRTWQVTGAFGGTGVLLPQGSNDGTNWATLSNQATGTPVSVSAVGIVETLERTRYVRPLLSPAGTAAAVAVTLIARRATPLRT